MGRSLRTRISTVVGFLGLAALVVRGWRSDDVSTAAAVAATALFGVIVLLFAWWVIDDWLLQREETAERPSLGHPPSDHRPIDVGRLVLTRGRGFRSGAGAALLMLAHEGIVDIDGLDSHRYVLRIPPDARGPTATENEILDEFRETVAAGAAVELVGPPLPTRDWGPRDYRIINDVTKRLIAEGLLRSRHWALVVPPLAIAIAPLTVGASAGLLVDCLGGLAAGFVMFLAAAGYAYTLTREGRTLRRSWLAYARWLRDNSELERVGPPGVAIWGVHLAYATVLGSAPTAARALSSS